MKLNDIYDKLHPLNWIRIEGNSTYCHSIFQWMPDGASQTTGSYGFGSERRWHRCTLIMKRSLDCTCGVGHPLIMTSLWAHFMRSKKNKYGLSLTSSSKPHIRPSVSAGIDSFAGSPYLNAVEKGCQLDLQIDHWVQVFWLPNLYTYKLKCLWWLLSSGAWRHVVWYEVTNAAKRNRGVSKYMIMWKYDSTRYRNNVPNLGGWLLTTATMEIFNFNRPKCFEL
jgi:hypothetical protein